MRSLRFDGRVRTLHGGSCRCGPGARSAGHHPETAGAGGLGPGPGSVEEPESRLMLETQETWNADVERLHYMPPFVAPQPIPRAASDDEDVDDGPDHVADDSGR